MATARKTASKAEELRVSQIGDFKKRMGGVIELPSGLVVKIKNPGGLQAFISNGSIPNSLLGLVQKTLDGKSKEEQAKQAAELAKDTESIAGMMKLLDIVAVGSIKEPMMRAIPTPEDLERHNILNPNNQLTDPDELRDENILYPDELEEMDKQFILQWVTGGTKDLETFRQKYQTNVAALSTVEGSERTAELTTGVDAR